MGSIKNERQSGVIKTMISALIYGFTPALCAMTYAMGNNHISMSFFRNLLVTPVALALVLIRRGKLGLKRDQIGKVFVTANLGALCTTLLLYSSYSYISIGMATTIHFMYPVLVILLCRIFFKEAVSRRQLGSIAFALIGIVCFLVSDRSGSFTGIALSFASSITFALYMVLMDRWGLSKMDGFQYAFWIAFIASSEMLIANGKLNFLIFNQPLRNYGMMFFIAVTTSVLGTIFLKEGVRILGSATASFISLLEPVSSIVFGVLLLGESVSLSQMIGCTAIIISIVNLTKEKAG